MKHRSIPYRIAKCFIVLFLAIMALFGVLPFIHVVALSMSGYVASEANLVGLLPVDLDWQAWKQVLGDSSLWKSLVVTFKRLVLGVPLTLLVSVPAAYVLSFEKRAFPKRAFYVVFFLVPMFFSGGLVPSYILMKQIKLIDSIWALVLPGTATMSVMILLLNFFRRIPKEIREAAEIDGASDFKLLWYVFIPLGMPCIITVAMFSAINHWNAWFDGVVYIRDITRYPLQTYVYSMLQSLNSLNIGMQDISEAVTVSRQTVKAAYTVFATVPIALMYPILQKYVKNGLVLGSVKG